MKAARSRRTCPKGHIYYKSSDCPTCPKCEKERAPSTAFLETLSRPARSALEHEGIDSVQQLSRYTEREVLGLHGIGPASLPALRAALQEAGLSFREKQSG